MKRVHPGLAHNGAAATRFLAEAQITAQLQHPAIIPVHDLGQHADGRLWFTMKEVRGRTLADGIAQVHAEGCPDSGLRRLVAALLTVCRAVAYAHERDVVHRDLKPGNVMITPHGDNEHVKVLDFGLVKELGKESELSRTGTVLGSPLYIAPEQVHGDAVDGRADIYTTGLMLYAMLMGKTAFERGNPLHVLMQQTQKRPPPFLEANPGAQVPSSLEWVVMTCLEKKPKDRFESMHELIRALKACAKQLHGDVETLRMELVDGKVVLPDGLDVSYEVRVAAMVSGNTTRLHKTQEAEVAADSPSQSTLMSTRPMRTVAMVVGGGSVFGGLVLAGLGVVLLAVVVTLLMTKPPEPTASSGAPTAPVAPVRPEPAPVAAPGSGLMAVGWLCVSTFISKPSSAWRALYTCVLGSG